MARRRSDGSYQMRLDLETPQSAVEQLAYGVEIGAVRAGPAVTRRLDGRTGARTSYVQAIQRGRRAARRKLSAGAQF